MDSEKLLLESGKSEERELHIEQMVRVRAFASQHGAVVVAQVFENGIAILQFPPNVLSILQMPIYQAGVA